MAGHWEVEGVDGVNAQFAAMAERVNAATDQAVDDALDLVQIEAQANLALKSHPALTPTPSAPGEPPALIFGSLRRSMRKRRDPSEPGRYSGRVGPTIIYGRIQELGGIITAHLRKLSWLEGTPEGGERRRFADHVTLPPRPFLKPAVIATRDAVRRVFRAAWERALRP